MLVPGQKLLNYVIVRQVGSGGMGEVYLAEDQRLKRQVAIKRLCGVDTHHKLIQEARAAARLNHPGIAAIYDVVQFDDQSHIVMEFVEGETLADRIHRERFSVDGAISLALEITEAIIHAHDRGIIHQDLKPRNILLTPDGKVKILDFGIAKAEIRMISDESTTVQDTNTGMLRGTPAYMSPEQLMAKPVDGRTDVYSTAIVLFEMLSGRRPFEGSEFMELAAAILTQRPPSLRSLRPDVPENLSTLIARAMARSREERPASMSALRDDLRALQSRMASAVSSTVSNSLPPGPEGPNRIVAILPFLNVTANPVDDFIGAGLWEVLIACVASMERITVLSRGAVNSYRDTARNVKSISRDLDAAYLVDGSFQRVGDAVRVTASLIDAASEHVLWSERIDGSATIIFEMQTTLGRNLIHALAGGHSPSASRARFPTDNKDAFMNYARARVLLERKDVRGNLARAAELLEGAVKRDPKFTLAHAALGETYWELYHQESDNLWTTKALGSLAEALRLNPDLADVHRTLARIYHGTGRNENAFEQLQLALKADPDSDETHCQFADVLFDLGRREEALEQFERAIQLRPNFWENHRSLGRAWYRMGHYDRAIMSFSRVVELQPDSPWGSLMLGTTYHAIGEYEHALLNYERSMSISPTSTAAMNIGTIWYDKKNFVEALRYYDLAIKLRPNKPLHHRNRGDACLKLGEIVKARESYERAVALTEELIRVNPKDAEEISRLSVYEAKLGRFENAIRHSQEASRFDPLRVEITYRKAVVYALAGKMVEAAGLLKVAAARGFSLARVRQDDDLAELRKSAAFIDVFGDHV